MTLHTTSIVITGGSRGLGRGLVEALASQGAKVTVIARPSADLDAIQTLPGVSAISADARDADAARRILAESNPDILVINAGTPPPMAPIDSISWGDFTATWDHDVKAALTWTQAALTLPLKPGSRVLMTSSGAAIGGSPMSGGYGGAKRMEWFMARYAHALAEQKGLGIRFQTVIPRQMVGGTGTGDAGSIAYAAAQGITQQAFLDRFGTPMTPRDFGERVVAILTDPRYAEATAFGVTGDGISILELDVF